MRAIPVPPNGDIGSDSGSGVSVLIVAHQLDMFDANVRKQLHEGIWGESNLPPTDEGMFACNTGLNRFARSPCGSRLGESTSPL